MSELRGVLVTGRDRRSLSHIGIKVDFSPTKYRDMQESCDEVHFQDGRMCEYWNLVFSLIRSRSTSLLRHILGLPEMLAGISHEDHEKQQASLEKFKKLYSAYDAAKQRAEPCVKAMVHKCLFGSTAIRWAVRFAEAAQWQRPSPQLDEWLEACWHSIGQTIIIENVNRELRDQEQRGSTAKTFRKFDKWARPVDKTVLQTFQRAEIDATSCGPGPVPQAFGDDVFQPQHGPDGSGDSVPLVEVTSKQDWVTYSTVSVLECYADMLLMQHGHDTGKWDALSGAWRSHFVPEGHLLVDKRTKTGLLVIKVLRGVVMGWPTRPVAPDGIEVLADTEALTLLPVLDLEHLHIGTLKVLSPLHWHLKGFSEPMGFRFNIVGGLVEVMNWQAEHAFAGVPEVSMKNMVDDLDAWQTDFGTSTDLKYSDKLALMLMLAYKTGLDRNTALALLLGRQVEESKETDSYLDEVSDEQITDCVLLGDQKETKEMVQSRLKSRAKRATEKASVQEMVETFFPKAEVAVKKALTKAQAKKRADATAAAKTRLYNSIDLDATATLRRELPAACRLTPDEKNGRWLLSYAGFRQRSVSWTQRGTTNAALMALEIGWDWHSQATADAMPDHLEPTG